MGGRIHKFRNNRSTLHHFHWKCMQLCAHLLLSISLLVRHFHNYSSWQPIIKISSNSPDNGWFGWCSEPLYCVHNYHHALEILINFQNFFSPPSFSSSEAPQRPDHGGTHREKTQPRAVATEGELVTMYNEWSMLHSTIMYRIRENFRRIKISPKFGGIKFCQCST